MLVGAGSGPHSLAAVNIDNDADLDLEGRTWRLQDLTGPWAYDRPGGDLTWRQLYLDLPAWGYHVFAVSPAE